MTSKIELLIANEASRMMRARNAEVEQHIRAELCKLGLSADNPDDIAKVVLVMPRATMVSRVGLDMPQLWLKTDWEAAHPELVQDVCAFDNGEDCEERP